MKILRLLMLTLSIAILTSCGTHRGTPTLTYNPRKDYNQYKSNTTKKDDKLATSSQLQTLSKKLGVSVTKADNQKLYSEAASWLGVPYKYGGTSRSGVDCSGFTYLMYKQVYGKTISRQSSAILTADCKKIKKAELKAGDLVFFRTDGKKSQTPNHVGIYLKEQKFIHASSSKGVVVSSLTNDYYVRNWIAAGRVSK